jgi:predicted transport protein
MSFQAYLDNIKKKTGKSAADFYALAKRKGILKPGFKASDVIAWLGTEYGLGRGHAMAIYAVLSSKDEPRLTTGERIAKHFSGRRSIWRAAYDRLLAKVKKFGDDVAVRPTDSYVSFVRGGKKFAIVQITADRFDVGIKLRSLKTNKRVSLAGTWNAMVTHRVRVDDAKELDAELIGWLRAAYDKA